MTFHTRLLNDDVLRIIFRHLHNPGRCEFGTVPGTALVNAVMTCKEFYQPALRVIWRHLRNLFPLFELFSAFMRVRTLVQDLPADELSDDEYPYQTYLYMINGPILPQEWERFHMHAQLVQVLGHSPLDSFNYAQGRCIAPSTVSCLGRLIGGTPILPNLRTLKWHIKSSQCMALFPLLSQSIDVLVLMVRHEDNTLTDDAWREWHASTRSTLFVIASVSRCITDLELRWCSYTRSPEHLSIAEPVSQLQSLRRFIATRADSALLRVLAALPSLQVLELGSIDISDGDSLMPAGAGFPRLQRLTVEEHPDATRFYQIFGTSCLRVLHTTFYEVAHYRDVIPCFTAWARHFPSLEELELCVYLDSEAAHHPRPYSSILDPLFQIRSLKSLKLNVKKEQFLLNDADIEAVAHSWTGLVRFWAGKGDGFDPLGLEEDTLPNTSPSALVLLALRCPQLRSLRIPRLRLDLPGTDALSRFPVLDHRLETLLIDRVYTNDCTLVALLIDQLFPHLEFSSDTLSGPDSEIVWKKVQHHIMICQTARKQQIQRIASRARASIAT